MAVLSHGCDPGQTPIVESCFIPPFSLVSGVPFVSLPNRPFLLEYVAMHPVAALQHQTMSLALHCPDPAARWPAMCSVLSSLGSVARCFNLLTLWVSGPPPPLHPFPTLLLPIILNSVGPVACLCLPDNPVHLPATSTTSRVISAHPANKGGTPPAAGLGGILNWSLGAVLEIVWRD